MNIDVLTEKEAAKLYKVSIRTLSNLRKDNKITYKKVGGVKKFNDYISTSHGGISI